MTVHVEERGPVTIVTIDRPEARNAVDGPTARALIEAFSAFDEDTDAAVAILCGAAGTFCAGADLKAVATDPSRANEVSPDGPGPMGPTWMQLSKPVLAAVEGYAVAGGLELALWCDLRVAAADAHFGVLNRRWGVPLIDGGTIRLPRTIGQGRALDMILTGRLVDADEAGRIGLADRVVPSGQALEAALELGQKIAGFPQGALRGDRASVLEQWGLPMQDALANEFERGLGALSSGEAVSGAGRFSSGEGRHGAT